METFDYTVRAENGIHARPAGLLVTHARNQTCRITIQCREKEADAKRLISVMGLGARQGDLLRFTIEGDEERSCRDSLMAFCQEHL